MLKTEGEANFSRDLAEWQAYACSLILHKLNIITAKMNIFVIALLVHCFYAYTYVSIEFQGKHDY